MKRLRKLENGFTLIEVMIAVTIMAALTLLTTRAIRSGILNREKFQGDLNREAAVRDALRIVERDINLTFHHRDIYTDLINQANQAAQQTTPPVTPVGGPGVPPPPPPPVPPVTGASAADTATVAALRTPPPEYTAFIGDEETLKFTSLSNVRLEKDAAESDQAEIGYTVKDCKTLTTGKGQRSRCLFRRVSTLIDDNILEGGTETVLLENVEKFSLRYLGPGSDEWQKTWKTKTPKTDGKVDFPYAVEVTVRTHNKNDPKDKPFGMQIVAALRFPNNAPPKGDTTSGTSTTTPKPPSP